VLRALGKFFLAGAAAASLSAAARPGHEPHNDEVHYRLLFDVPPGAPPPPVGNFVPAQCWMRLSSQSTGELPRASSPGRQESGDHRPPTPRASRPRGRRRRRQQAW